MKPTERIKEIVSAKVENNKDALSTLTAEELFDMSKDMVLDATLQYLDESYEASERAKLDK